MTTKATLMSGDAANAVIFAVAEMWCITRHDVREDTILPLPRAKFFGLVFSRTENPGMAPYTGEATRVGELISALTVEGTTLKWIPQ